MITIAKKDYPTLSEYRIVGPPGTGKTSEVAKQVGAAVRAGKRVVVASLTRAAAAEAAGRDMPIGRESVGTLHSFAYRALGARDIADSPKMLAEWNKEHPFDTLTGGRDMDSDNLDTAPGEGGGDERFNAMNLNRARMIPRIAWPLSVEQFADQWDDWKEANGLLDFTDLIEQALDCVKEAPNSPDILFVDEAQDMDALEMALVRKWATAAGGLVTVGDPDQCQPGETMVRVTGGSEVRLDDLDADYHRLVSYDRHSGVLVGTQRQGHGFEKTYRYYNGVLYTVVAGERSTRCTHDHRWLARWADTDAKWNVVYLMQKDDRFRVGWCQLFQNNTDGVLHLGTRARLERADKTWILGHFATKAEASEYESVVAIRYGLPLVTFAPCNKGYASKQNIDYIFNSLDADEQRKRAFDCLLDHNRDPLHPFIDSAHRHAKQGKRTPQVVRACNLIPGLMTVPVTWQGSRRVTWQAARIDRQRVERFPVYSLNVEPHHNYVADGIVTMNNLYKWRGADPKVFYESPITEDHERILSQSYRVPRDVWSQAMGWIGRDQTRRQVAYQPRDEEGKVIRRDATWKTPDSLLLDIEDALANGKSVMALASCSYMLRPLIAVLRQAGIPFHNPYRRNRGDWNPLGRAKGRAKGKVSGSERLLAFTQMVEMGEWSRDNLWRWLEAVKVKNVYRNEGKEWLEWLELLDDMWVSHDDLHMILTDEAIGAGMSGDLGWLSQQLLASKRRGMEYPMDIYEARGREALEKSPQVVVGTVHSVKGAEADVVCLFPDLSPRGMEEWDSGDPHQQADVYRLFYVAMTRAKESLVIAEPGGGMAVDLSSDG